MHVEEIIESPTITPAPVKKRSKLKRFIKWSLISIFSFITLLVASAFIIVYFFEDDIKKYAIQQINKEVNTKIEVDDISLSLFKKFPLASLEFKNVRIKEMSTNTAPENLLEAESVFLEFSVWDIFRKKYTFKEMSIEKGRLNLKVYKDGTTNFDILKKQEDKKKENKDKPFKFSKFDIRNIFLTYTDFKAHQKLLTDIQKFSCSGAFTQKQFNLKSNTKFKVYSFTVNEDEFLTNKQITLRSSIKVDLARKQYDIQNALVELEKMSLSLKGFFKFEDQSYVDMVVEGKNLNVQSFLSLLPDSYKSFEENYKSKGSFYLSGRVVGIFGENKAPAINMDFGVSNGKVEFKENNQVLKNFTCKGNFSSKDLSQPRSNKLTLNQFHGELEKSTISGDFIINNFIEPELAFAIDADVDLDEIFTFIEFDKIESIGGRMKLNLSYHGKMSGNEFSIDDYKNSSTTGNATLTEVSLQLKDKPLTLSECSGQITFENTSGSIPELSGKLNSTRFSMNGTAENLLEFMLLENYPLVLKSNITCDQILVEDFLVKKVGPQKEVQKTIQLPKDVNLKLKTEVGKLEFKKFRATNIKGFIILTDQKLLARNLKFESCDGTASISGSIDTKDPMEIKTEAFGSFQRVQIDQLFSSFKNFSQKTLEDKNLKGQVTANITYKASYNENLKLIKPTLYVYSPLEIQKGELINFKPLEGLSKFIAVEELRHIKFSLLKNDIEIKDEAIHIPKMTIQSSAINLEIGGIHYFDNRIEYYFNLLLKDVLAKKFRKKKKESEFGEIIEEEGGARIYLKMIGTMDNYKISVDGKGVREKIKDDFKKENQDLKQMFYEEFGAFKNDTTIKKTKLRPKKKDKNKVESSDDFEFEF